MGKKGVSAGWERGECGEGNGEVGTGILGRLLGDWCWRAGVRMGVLE